MISKKKAIVCTVLYVAVIVGLLTCSYFIRNEKFGISLYQIIMYAIANICIGNSISRFYDWMMH